MSDIALCTHPFTTSRDLFLSFADATASDHRWATPRAHVIASDFYTMSLSSTSVPIHELLPPGTLLSCHDGALRFRTSDHRWYTVDPFKLPYVYQPGDLGEALVRHDPACLSQHVHPFYALDAGAEQKAQKKHYPLTDSHHGLDLHALTGEECLPHNVEEQLARKDDPYGDESDNGQWSVIGTGLLADALRGRVASSHSQSPMIIAAVSDEHPGTQWIEMDQHWIHQPHTVWVRAYVDGNNLLIEPVSMGAGQPGHAMTQARLRAAAEHPELDTAPTLLRGPSVLTHLHVHEGEVAITALVQRIIETTYAAIRHTAHTTAPQPSMTYGWLTRVQLDTMETTTHPVFPIPECEDFLLAPECEEALVKPECEEYGDPSRKAGTR
ncbi:hypothetical protein GSS87_07415 [Corynebacterium sp. 4HC-13]|uniref:hypothetical protein n=1 Tax=Corynebacterium anserum TaxID=2684406 RepID=UPI001639675C|nr:hypothetical protein [Corynebacterium anserum]MBC2682225.1 hypothetical protein [Corynebacterium anserum]